MLKTGSALLPWFLMLASAGCDGEREPPAPPAPSTGSPAQAASPSPATPQGPAPATPSTSSGSPEVIAGFPGMTGPALRAYVGKFEHGALVNLWASWCGSCKRELPMLKQTSEDFGEHGLGLVTISADTPEVLPKARELLNAAGLKTDAFYLANGVSMFRRAVDNRWKGAIPATFLIDQTGKVRYFWNGPVLADEIRDVVQRYLAGDPIDGMTDFTVSH